MCIAAFFLFGAFHQPMSGCYAEVEHVIHLPQGAELPGDSKTKQLMMTTARCCVVYMLFENVVVGVMPPDLLLCISSKGVCLSKVFVCARAGLQEGFSFKLAVVLLIHSLAWWRPLHFSETVIQRERRGNKLWWVDLPTAGSCQHSGQWRLSRGNVSIQTGSVIINLDYWCSFNRLLSFYSIIQAMFSRFNWQNVWKMAFLKCFFSKLITIIYSK